MKASEMQFSDPKLNKLSFSINQNFDLDNLKDHQLSNKLDVNISRLEGKPEAYVELTIQINEDHGKDAPFVLEIAMGARFTWNDSIISEEESNDYLTQNAPVLLLSYSRPAIAEITGMSPFPRYNIPFIDFSNTNA